MKNFNEIHYPRDPGKWAVEKHAIRMNAYHLAEKNGPDMADIFHIKRASCDLTFCGMTATDDDLAHDATVQAWVDGIDRLHVPCTSCHEARYQSLPDPDKLDTNELIEGLEASGLNVITLDEDTDFSSLPSLDVLLGGKGDS